MSDSRLAGIGMTSARTRERLVQRLQEQKITNVRVLDRIRQVPRHLFVDEALASPGPTKTPPCPSGSVRPSPNPSSSRA